MYFDSKREKLCSKFKNCLNFLGLGIIGLDFYDHMRYRVGPQCRYVCHGDKSSSYQHLLQMPNPMTQGSDTNCRYVYHCVKSSSYQHLLQMPDLPGSTRGD